MKKSPQKNNKLLPKDYINFTIDKIDLPAKGTCYFCQGKGIASNMYHLMNAKQVIVCNRCSKKQKKRSEELAEKQHVDAMYFLVPGSYGSNSR